MYKLVTISAAYYKDGLGFHNETERMENVNKTLKTYKNLSLYKIQYHSHLNLNYDNKKPNLFKI